VTTLDLFGTWRLAEPLWLHAAWGALVLPALIVWWARRREQRMARFAESDRLDDIVGRRRWWPVLARAVVVAVACLGLAAALARPQSDPVEVESERTGRNVIFLLDVSRSMLATDVAPNRLERSKLWISDLVAELQGDRFALVAFAGGSAVVSPLTSDRAFFRMALDEVSPETVPRGGTNIGDAIRKTTELLLPETAPAEGRVYYDIVLITDGEDQESLPAAAAQAAAQRGARIIALGIGSPEGATIAADGDAGPGGQAGGVPQTVRTRLEASTLAAIAGATPGGVFLEVGTGTVDLARLYRELIASADQDSMERASILKFAERFGWFLWPALVLLLVERVLIPAGSRRAAW
jgi:Ca-activated chloride channel family protein